MLSEESSSCSLEADDLHLDRKKNNRSTPSMHERERKGKGFSSFDVLSRIG